MIGPEVPCFEMKSANLSQCHVIVAGEIGLGGWVEEESLQFLREQAVRLGVPQRVVDRLEITPWRLSKRMDQWTRGFKLDHVVWAIPTERPWGLQ